MQLDIPGLYTSETPPLALPPAHIHFSDKFTNPITSKWERCDHSIRNFYKCSNHWRYIKASNAMLSKYCLNSSKLETDLKKTAVRLSLSLELVPGIEFLGKIVDVGEKQKQFFQTSADQYNDRSVVSVAPLVLKVILERFSEGGLKQENIEEYMKSYYNNEGNMLKYLLINSSELTFILSTLVTFKLLSLDAPKYTKKQTKPKIYLYSLTQGGREVAERWRYALSILHRTPCNVIHTTPAIFGYRFNDEDCVQLIVDTREGANSRIEWLKFCAHHNISMRFMALDLGDFHMAILHNAVLYSLRIVVERKTVIDLTDSVIDGRFKSQSDNLKQCVDQKMIDIAYYIIENTAKDGSLDDWIHQSTRNKLGRDALNEIHIQTEYFKTILTPSFASSMLALCEGDLRVRASYKEFLRYMYSQNIKKI